MVVFTLCIVAGCSDGKLKTTPVTGTIKYKGEPVSGATVSFSPTKEGAGDGAVGRTDDKGVYKLQTAKGNVDAGTTPGEYIVMVTKSESVETGVTRTDSTGAVIPEMTSKRMLPAKYATPGTPLKATVTGKKKDNVFNFDLED